MSTGGVCLVLVGLFVAIMAVVCCQDVHVYGWGVCSEADRLCLVVFSRDAGSFLGFSSVLRM